MKASHRSTENKSNRRLANMALKAMSLICDYDNGTINNPCELASTIMDDGRTLIQTIYQDGYVRFNDGWFIVEVDDFCLYVDITGMAVKELNNIEYEIISDFEEVLEDA